jgi:DNA-3-methyladenine glycosylase II
MTPTADTLDAGSVGSAAGTAPPAQEDDGSRPTTTTQLEVTGPYSLAEVALMGFGHRDESFFDGAMRLAFCVDGDFERQVGVEVRQSGQRLDLRIVGSPGSAPFDDASRAVIGAQVARVLSVDHDGAAFDALCRSDPALARVHAVAPGFRPALFHSPYEGAVWSILSARRARSQGIGLRERLGQQHGATFELAGQQVVAVPTPEQLLRLESFAGLPADRVPRLHAIALAAQAGRLSAARLLSLDPAEAARDLQSLPGIGPFYSSLILIRASGATDLLSLDESLSRDAVRQVYGWDRNLSDSEYTAFAERWRPWRTWVVVMARALGSRLSESDGG